MRLLLLLISSLCFAQTVAFPGPGMPASTGFTVASPTDSPGAGTYTSAQTVTLSCATPGALICYRLDGTNPAATTPGSCDPGSTAYSTGFSVSTTTTVLALGTKAGRTNSGVLSSLYTIAPGTQFLVPGSAYLNTSGSRQFLVPGGGIYVNAH